jgi:hypothetical protein
MKKTIAILIDGGFLRSLANKARLTYDPDFVASFAASCATNQEEIFRILYYDCAPFVGQAKLPVSGTIREFKGDSRWLDELAAKDPFATSIIRSASLQPYSLYSLFPAFTRPSQTRPPSNPRRPHESTGHTASAA